MYTDCVIVFTTVIYHLHFVLFQWPWTCRNPSYDDEHGWPEVHGQEDRVQRMG